MTEDNSAGIHNIEVKVQLLERVAFVCFTDGNRNTFTIDGIEMLADAIKLASRMPGARCVVIHSTTKGYFSDGFSLRELFGNSTREGLLQNEFTRYNNVVDAFKRIVSTDIPVLAYVDGLCRGAGLELALLADFIISTNESSFALHEIRLGIVPGLGGLEMLAFRIGHTKSAFTLFSGEPLNANQSLQIGLVDSIETTLSDVNDFSLRIASRPLSSLIRTKKLLGWAEKKILAIDHSRQPFLDSLRQQVLGTSIKRD